MKSFLKNKHSLKGNNLHTLSNVPRLHSGRLKELSIHEMGKNYYLYLRIILNLGAEFELILEILPGYGDIVSWITIIFVSLCM